MPYDEEDPPLAEPDQETDAFARAVVDAAYEVFRRLGPGLDEMLYENAMCVERRLRGIPFARQVDVPVTYKGELIGKKRIDLIVAEKLVVEIKAVEALSALHRAQVLTYLKILKLQLGLLINFNSALFREGVKRIINPTEI